MPDEWGKRVYLQICFKNIAPDVTGSAFRETKLLERLKKVEVMCYVGIAATKVFFSTGLFG